MFVEQSVCTPQPQPRPQRPSVPRHRIGRPSEASGRGGRKPESVQRILRVLDLGALEAAQIARMLWLPYEVTRRALSRLEEDGLVSRGEARAPRDRGRPGAPAFTWRRVGASRRAA